MNKVRFASVVQKCGKPEVYLLMSATDPAFHKALKEHRVMTLLGDLHGSGIHFGKVGYQEKERGQLLVFLKSLKAFEDARIVGIKYDLFAEEAAEKSAKRPVAKKLRHRRRHCPNRLARRQRRRANEGHPRPAPAKSLPFQKIVRKTILSTNCKRPSSRRWPQSKRATQRLPIICSSGWSKPDAIASATLRAIQLPQVSSLT